ncbi:CHAP domain-containing protein [Rothia kristinae]|uniref:CHAP domain-containing protein n=1 Tax=Rothia kristinae TaxID=37923 RepID=UPI00119FCE5D|nr:CHAP domain-containing protein [Rothia kristinae]
MSSEDATGSSGGGWKLITLILATVLGITLLPVLAVMVVLLITATMASAECEPASSPGVGEGAQDLAEGQIPKEYVEDIKNAAKVSGVPASVLAAQIQQESGFNPNVCSPAGACGIAQFIESTWQKYGHGADRSDPHAGIRAQGEYMRDLMNTIAGVSKSSGKSQVELALAAYNAGEGAVLQNQGIPPYAETQNYVRLIMASAEKYRNATGENGGSESPKTDAAGIAALENAPLNVVTVADENKTSQAQILNGDKLQKDAFQLAKAIQDQFPEVETIGGWRPSDPIAQDHPDGRAVDIMIPDYASDGGKKLGNEINHYVWKNKDRFGVVYSIWRQDLYNSGADRPYSHMEDRGSDTQNHMDHVHVTVTGGGPNDGKSGDIPKRDGSGTTSGSDDKTPTGDQCGDQSATGTGSYSGGSTSGKDDYPWADLPDAVNPTSGFYYRQCTDFAWWRLNQQLGGDKVKASVTNTSFAPGHRLGNGGEWDDAWRAKGWPVDHDPEVGAMAVFKKGVSGADPTYGHIAVVKEVHGDKVIIEEYNALTPRGYGTRELDKGAVSWYLHIPDSEKKK